VKKLVSLDAPLDDGFLTPDQLCEYLQIQKDWLYDQVQRRAIPHVKLGRQLRFKRSEIDQWLAGHQREAEAESN
jgi:excisionase family DNA binding protein